MRPLTIGQWVRLWRERAGLTRLELAATVGGSRSSVSDLEDGRTDVSRQRLAAIARACGAHPLEVGQAVALPVAPASDR